MDDRMQRIVDLGMEIKNLEATRTQRSAVIGERLELAVKALAGLKAQIADAERSVADVRAERLRVDSGEDLREKRAEWDALIAPLQQVTAPVVKEEPRSSETPITSHPLHKGIRPGNLWYAKAMREAQYHAIRIEQIVSDTHCQVTYLDTNGGDIGNRRVLVTSILGGHCESEDDARKAVRPDYAEKCDECGVRMLDIVLAVTIVNGALVKGPKPMHDAVMKQGLLKDPVSPSAIANALRSNSKLFTRTPENVYSVTTEGRQLVVKHIGHLGAPAIVPTSTETLPTVRGALRDWKMRFIDLPTDFRSRMTPEVVQTNQGPALLVPSCQVTTLDWLATVDDCMPGRHPRYIDRGDFKVQEGQIWLKAVHLEEGMVVAGAVRTVKGDKKDTDYQKWYKIQGGELVSIGVGVYGHLVVDRRAEHGLNSGLQVTTLWGSSEEVGVS